MKTTVAALLCLIALCGAVFVFTPKSAHAPEVKAQQEPSASKPILSVQPGVARIFAAGDIMLDRKIRVISQMSGADYPFSCIEPLVKSADFAVANLEGSITDNPSKSAGSTPGSYDNYFFTFPTTTGEVLKRNGIDAVDLGNNHILNFGYGGLISTQENLSHAGVGYFGGIDGNEGEFD